MGRFDRQPDCNVNGPARLCVTHISYTGFVTALTGRDGVRREWNGNDRLRTPCAHPGGVQMIFREACEMPTPLPPEDQPPNPGLVPTDDVAALLADAGPDSPENPVAVGAAFLNVLADPAGPNRAVLAHLVTPESLPAWGDFTDAAAMIGDCGMTSRANPSDTDPDVVYVKYVSSDGQNYRAASEMMIMVRAVGTLVRRPELGGWRVHGVGDYLAPDQVPR